jgi:hypothetical protein
MPLPPALLYHGSQFWNCMYIHKSYSQLFHTLRPEASLHSIQDVASVHLLHSVQQPVQKTDLVCYEPVKICYSAVPQPRLYFFYAVLGASNKSDVNNPDISQATPSLSQEDIQNTPPPRKKKNNSDLSQLNLTDRIKHCNTTLQRIGTTSR